MAHEENETGAMDPRSMALQDLKVVSEKLDDLTRQMQPLLEEKAELEAFLRRYARYEGAPDDAPSREHLVGTVHIHRKSDRSLRPFVISPKAYQALFRGASDSAASAIAATRLTEAATSAASASQAALEAAVSATMASVTPALGYSAAATAASAAASAANARPKTIPSDGSRRGRVAGLALMILNEAGAATTKELAQLMRMDQETYGFLGVKPEATLSSYLSRDPRFVFDHSVSHWRIDQAWAQAHSDQDAVCHPAWSTGGRAS